MYSCASPTGLVSSKRRWQRPPNSWAIPKLSAIALEWPRGRAPFGSGGAGDRFVVAEVEVSVRLGREARHYRRDSALTHVGGDGLVDEIASFGRGWIAGAHVAVARHPE